MMRKVEITVETAETIVVRKTTSIRREFCPICEALVDMVSPYVVSAISGISERAVFMLIERSVLHYVETDRLFICLNSIDALKGDVKQ
jgi:hypothetical protein